MMDDYFTKLAERTLSLTKVVRPQISSMYEPGQNLVNGNQQDIEQIEAIVEQKRSNIPVERRNSIDNSHSDLVTLVKMHSNDINSSELKQIESSQLVKMPETKDGSNIAVEKEEIGKNNLMTDSREPYIDRIKTRKTIRPLVTYNLKQEIQEVTKLKEALTRKSSVPDTIQVKIGRIEVKAVMSSEKPKPIKKSKSDPKLSLDEYLKQRSGDRR